MSQSNASQNTMLERAQANYALDLLREVSNSNSSTVVSPISVLFPLAMVYVGARGETAEELQKILAGKEGESNESQIHAYFGELLKAINDNEKNSKNPGTLLAMANKVFVKSGFPLEDTFTATIEQNYGMGENNIKQVDFRQSAETAKRINEFVEKATRDKIHDLISPDSLDALTRLVLVNAVYFNGRWAEPFDPQSTRKGQFHVSENEQKEVEMMHDDDRFIFFQDDDLQLLGLPYLGEEMFMFVLLPRERFELNEMLAKLSGEKLLEFFVKRGKTRVMVSLPKFKLESTHDLNEPLKKLGLTTAFSNGANFSGISSNGEKLAISKVLQKAFIEVNEHGTEAAAATALKVTLMSMPPSFRADHPFAFFLVASTGEKKSEQQHQNNMIVFSGVFRGD